MAREKTLQQGNNKPEKKAKKVEIESDENFEAAFQSLLNGSLGQEVQADMIADIEFLKQRNDVIELKSLYLFLKSVGLREELVQVEQNFTKVYESMTLERIEAIDDLQELYLLLLICANTPEELLNIGKRKDFAKAIAKRYFKLYLEDEQCEDDDCDDIDCDVDEEND